jgi:acyl dehydratase
MTSISEGTPVPAIERRIGIADMVAYAGATWDWHRMHYDMEYVEAAGFTAPIVDGQMLGALMAECVQDWLGPDARLVKLGFRFLTPVSAGSVIRCEGVTDSFDDGLVSCSLTAYVVDAAGSIIATAASGHAELRVP